MIDLSLKDLKTIKKILNEHFPNYEILVFGSRVNGKAKEYSDIDIALRWQNFGQKIDIFKFGNAKLDLMESDISVRVDLLDWEKIDENFQKIISQNYEVLE